MSYAYATLARKASPFGYVPGEKLCLLPGDNPRFLILTDIQKEILLAIHKCRAITASLLHRYLIGQGVMYEIACLRRDLKKLAQCRYLKKFEYRTEDAFTLYKVYMLDRLGAEYIRSTGCRVCQSEVDDVQCKSHLSALQYMLSQDYCDTPERLIIDQKVTQTEDVSTDSTCQAFWPRAVVQRSDTTIIVDAVRQKEGALQELIEKLDRMEATLSCAGALNILRKENMQVVIVCEDKYHMAKVFDCLRAAPKEYSFTLMLSNDQESYESSDCTYIYHGKKPLSQRIADGAAWLIARLAV